MASSHRTADSPCWSNRLRNKYRRCRNTRGSPDGWTAEGHLNIGNWAVSRFILVPHAKVLFRLGRLSVSHRQEMAQYLRIRRGGEGIYPAFSLSGTEQKCVTAGGAWDIYVGSDFLIVAVVVRPFESRDAKPNNVGKWRADEPAPPGTHLVSTSVLSAQDDNRRVSHSSFAALSQYFTQSATSRALHFPKS